ncbi:beta-glucanase [Kitasatospora sp. NPDC002227]|uniref:beta-glucanase n=1 Tax=Kitasatospora sp. NPDC002227 TaxID=3154773 RepID=UPI0033169882
MADLVFDAPFSDSTQWAAGVSSAYPPSGQNTGDNKLDRIVRGYGPDGDTFAAVRLPRVLGRGRWKTPLVTTEGTAGGFELLPGDLLEADCQVLQEQGAWPAIWTWGRDVTPGHPQPGHGEVDVFEYHDDHPQMLELTNHVRAGESAYADGLVTPGRWFRIGCRFGADAVVWYVDGEQVHSDGAGVGPDWRAYLIVSLSIAAGHWGHLAPAPNQRRISWQCRNLTVHR